MKKIMFLLLLLLALASCNNNNNNPVITAQYTVTTSNNPSSGGTTSGGGTYNSVSSVIVTASPNSGYTFSNWTENGNVVSTSSSYTFTISSSRTLVANFLAVQYTVTTNSNPSSGGTTSSGGTYNSGSSVTVTATPNSGYTFTNWTEKENIVSTSSSYTFTIISSRILVANFATDTGLIGTWMLTSISGTTPQGSITVSPGLVGISMTMVFNNNNTATLTTVQQGQTTTQSFTWIDLNSIIILAPSNGGVVIPLPYTKTGNKINVGYSNMLPSITYNGVTITSLILEFTRQ